MVMCGFGAWGGAISLAQRRKDLRRGRVMVYGFGGGGGGGETRKSAELDLFCIYIYLFIFKEKRMGRFQKELKPWGG